MASTSNNEIMDSEDNKDVNPVDNCNEENVSETEIPNDDCLTHIFTFLPRKQLIRIERVCNRLKGVALSCWSRVKNVFTIDIVQGSIASVNQMACYPAHTEASTSTSMTEAMPSKNKDDVNNCDNKCKIDILNDDCLEHIFKFLPQEQWIMIETVCERWQDVLVSHCWSTVKKVSTFDIARPDASVIRQMACYLQHIVKYCEALRSLEVINVYPLEEIIFSGSLMQLEELTLEGCKLTDAGLRNVLSICPNIRALTICTCTEDLSVESLQFLNLQELKLVLKQCSCEFMDSLIASFKRMEKLKSLSLKVHKSQEVTSKQFQQILENSPNLEHLTVTNCKLDTITAIETSTFGIPRNLVLLDLHDNSLVNNALLKEISENCVTLESLDISGWCNVNDEGIHMLANLPNLKCLSVGQLRKSFYVDDYVTDYELELLASRRKLAKLQISYNSKITGEGCAKILSQCKELEYLNLRGCCNITNETVMLANTAVKKRSNNKKLELVLEGTEVSPLKDHWKDLTPFLKLDFESDWKQY